MKPRLFIASSIEGKNVVDALVIALHRDGDCTPWSEAFPLSNNTIDTLLERCAENDFAIFIFSPDDRAEIRGNVFAVTRDNVLFESGLFMGMHGKKRCFVVIPQDSATFRMATDFAGFTPAVYDHERAKNDARPALAAAAAEIREAIRKSEWAQRRVILKTFSRDEPDANFKLKLYVQFKNNQSIALAIESRGLVLASDILVDPLANHRTGEGYPFEFYLGREANDPKKDKNVPKCVVEPGQTITSWIPIDPTLGDAALGKRVRSQEAGTLRYRVTWLGDLPTTRYFEDKI